MDDFLQESRSTLLPGASREGAGGDLREFLSSRREGLDNANVSPKRSDHLDFSMRVGRRLRTRSRSKSPVKRRSRSPVWSRLSPPTRRRTHSRSRSLSENRRRRSFEKSRSRTRTYHRASNERHSSHRSSVERSRRRRSRSRDRSHSRNRSSSRRYERSRKSPISSIERATRNDQQDRPASPLPLSEYDRVMIEKDRKDQEAIADELDELEEVDDVVFPEVKDNEDDNISLSSLPSAEENDPKDNDCASLLSIDLESAPEDEEPEKEQKTELKEGEKEEVSDEKVSEEPGTDEKNEIAENKNKNDDQEKPHSSDRNTLAGSPISDHSQSNSNNIDTSSFESFNSFVKRQPNGGRKREVKCDVCNAFGHVGKQCAMLVCSRCDECGHYAHECPKQPGGPPSIPTVTRGNKKVFVYSESGELIAGTGSSDPRGRLPLPCYNCKQVGHQIKYCPSLVCKKCGARGHFAKECRNFTDEFKPRPSTSSSAYPIPSYMQNPPPIRHPSPPVMPAPRISFDYGHSSSTVDTANVTIQSERTPFLPSKSLQDFYTEKLSAKGKPLSFARDMILTWRLAGHTEDTLKEMYLRERPHSSVQLRLMFVKELGHVPAGQIPMSLNVSDLLDETVDYFMPQSVNPMQSMPQPPTVSTSSLGMRISSSDSRGGASHMQNLESALQNVSSMQRFMKLDNLIAEINASDPRRRSEYEGRLHTLEPLRDYISRKMRVMSEMFGISDNYIFTVSSTIQKLLAHVGLCSYTLQRMFATFGLEGLEEQAGEKLRPFADHFPSGVSVRYIVSIVGDYLRELIR